MKRFLLILPVLALFIPLILDSCNFGEQDPLQGCNGFGFLKVINNSRNIYVIVIDNDSVNYCAEVRPKNTQMCDVFRGNHNIKIGTPGNWVCEQDITATECEITTVFCNNNY